MICNMCNERNAVLLVQQVSVEGKKEVHLCPQCAKARGIDVGKSNVGTSVQDIVETKTLTKKACYVCGRTLDIIQKTGLLGCPECYMSFNTEIKTFLAQKEVLTPYVGSMPKKLEHFRSILTDRIEIQKKLDISIANENYEKAAMYRDFLNALERTAIATSDEEGDAFDK